MHADGNAQPEGLLIHFRQQAHAASEGDAGVMGFSETRRTPCCARSLTNCSASRPACSASTSNSGQILLATISDNGVYPSAACQITVATSFRVKKVESTADIIIISPPMRRAAMAELLAMYFSAMTSPPAATVLSPTPVRREQISIGVQVPFLQTRMRNGRPN